MSTILCDAVKIGHSLEELADLDRHDDVRRARVVLPVVILTEEQLAAVDETGDIDSTPDRRCDTTRNCLVRAFAVAQANRFEECGA